MPPGPSRVPSGPRRARAGMASGSDRGSGGVNSDPSAHPWTAPEATRPERLLSTSARPPRPACPSPLRLGQAIDPIEQEPGMPTSKIDRMPLLLVALVLAAAAVPGRALDLDPRHDGIDTADLSVTVTNKSRRRVEQIAQIGRAHV